MRIDNLTTGEATLIQENGREVHLLFDAQAVHMIESRLEGRSAFDLIADIRERRPTLSIVALIISAGTAGWKRRNGNSGRAMTPSASLEVIDGCGGVAEVLPILTESMARSRTLGLVKEDEADAEGEGEEAFGLDFEKGEGSDARPPGRGPGSSGTPQLLGSHPGASGP